MLTHQESLKPSSADEDLSHKIKEAAKYFDIKVPDHIVSDPGYFSFADEGIFCFWLIILLLDNNAFSGIVSSIGNQFLLVTIPCHPRMIH
jgi:hypothetical protein